MALESLQYLDNHGQSVSSFELKLTNINFQLYYHLVKLMIFVFVKEQTFK